MPMSSGRALTFGIAALVVLVLIFSGFLVNVRSTTVDHPSFALVTTVDDTFTTSSTTLVPINSTSTATHSVWDETDVTLKATHHDMFDANISAGTDVQLSWQASEQVNVFIFDAAEFSSYNTSTRSTGSNVASGSGSSGSIGFQVSQTGEYYLIVENPNNGLFGLGASAVGYMTTGTASSQVPGITYATQTVTYTTSSTEVVTTSSTSATTETCWHDFWAWVYGSSKCE
jgi:hypothetical protein